MSFALGLIAVMEPMVGPKPVLRAQETIQTDRPGLAHSPISVPRGSVQLEIGLPLIEIAEDGVVEATTVRAPVIAVRWGAFERVELRAASPLYNRIEIDEGANRIDETGNGDLELGFKWHALADGGLPNDFSVIGSVVLPVGDEPFTLADDRAGYSLLGVAGWPLDPKTSLTSVTGVISTPVDEDERATSSHFVAWLGRALAQRLSGYIEAGWFPSNRDSAPVLAGAGLAFLVSPVMQLDVSFDRGVNDDATDWIFGGGVSARF
jgi:hypothetical protein